MSAALHLVIGNKNYSSWSMRPWVLMHGLYLPFEEQLLKFESEDWRANIARLSPSRMVPVLWEGEPGKGFATWDTLAIAERLHELHPKAGVWPADAQARAHARAYCAEFHSGFQALRGAMPMNIRGRYPGKGMSPDVEKDIERIVALWTEARRRFGAGGPYLFGAFGAADAYFAPVATRFVTYAVDLPAVAYEYQQVLLATPAVVAWSADAEKETEFVAADEPYATP
ncbi:MAG TPA: glutathione S-transferase family protein [Burkholderiales bacterium]|nr:glutathione S-transferase family protein [Burkholderiales bacterium]